MKYIVNLLLMILLVGCANPNNTSSQTHITKATVGVAVVDKKMSALLQDSQTTNHSAEVSKLVKTAVQDINNPEPLYNLGYLHMQTALNNKNMHEQELAVTYFNEVLTMVPGNQAVLNALYSIYYDNTYNNRSLNAFEKAKDIYQQLPESARDKLNPPSVAKYAATVLWQEKQRSSNRQELREILLQAIQENPRGDIAYIQLAKLYTDDRYFSLALATLKLGNENIHESVELLKAIANTYDKRADVNDCNYEHKNDIANAAAYYQQAIPLKPNEASLHYNLSREYFDQNLMQLAFNEAQIALELSNQADDFATNAQNFSMYGNNAKANELMQRALAKGYNINHNDYHEVQMNQGDWKNAAKGFDAYLKTRTTYSVYDLIKSDIISQQAQLSPWIVNKKISLGSDWEEALFNYWSAKTSADDLKKSAHNVCQKTEYFFYTGYQDYRAGQNAQAKTKFTAALNQNTYRFIERPLARYFLQQN